MEKDKTFENEEQVKDPIQVIELDQNKIRVEHEDGRFVEGRLKMPYGMKKFVENMNRPSRMRYKGDDDIIVETADYTEKKDPDIYILQNMLTAWSKNEEITRHAIINDWELTDLFDRFVEEIKEKNNLIRNLGKNRKKGK
ncbi:hypothetical protein BBF96_03525 [Anoxybacter fermentans]|uniref:Tail assembly chaperone n=1 Tax=Anoxybacter fermentans TaxID=1323375 RepID=A0A3Q9HP71_9FIRM|nr:hypothetical protein [Anoxybacter fermentans]AZR72533.1 hypothetical protein BBF96_03525 [Anoxybacter fermentans]